MMTEDNDRDAAADSDDKEEMKIDAARVIMTRQ